MTSPQLEAGSNNSCSSSPQRSVWWMVRQFWVCCKSSSLVLTELNWLIDSSCNLYSCFLPLFRFHSVCLIHHLRSCWITQKLRCWRSWRTLLFSSFRWASKRRKLFFPWSGSFAAESLQGDSHQNDERLANHAHLEIAPDDLMQLPFRDVVPQTLALCLQLRHVLWWWS